MSRLDAPAVLETSKIDQAPAVRVRDLRMRYGKRDTLQGIQLDVRSGEILALLGPNGAGKTTTVEILEGYRRRSGGEVTVLGTDPDRADDAWRGRLGIVMQSWRDHARWRVGELLGHFARYYPEPRDPNEVLRLVDLTTQTRELIGHLSGGQRRRLDVALGILGRPELLFLDEPTTGFDPQARHDFHLLVERLNREEGMTIVLTTHDLVEAERLAHRIAILVDGRILASGTADQLAQLVRAQAEVRWTENGTPHRESTANPSELVWRLHQRIGGPVQDLEVRRPTLEDSYLSMIARKGQK